MNITRQSHLTGVVRTRDLPITQEQLTSWEAGELAQRAFPGLSATDREFIITGTTQEEWDAAMAEQEEDDEHA